MFAASANFGRQDCAASQLPVTGPRFLPGPSAASVSKSGVINSNDGKQVASSPD
jgi:hypothetical protein